MSDSSFVYLSFIHSFNEYLSLLFTCQALFLGAGEGSALRGLRFQWTDPDNEHID